VGRSSGIDPTGKEVSWTSIEVYRVENQRVAAVHAGSATAEAARISPVVSA